MNIVLLKYYTIVSLISVTSKVDLGEGASRLPFLYFRVDKQWTCP